MTWIPGLPDINKDTDVVLAQAVFEYLEKARQLMRDIHKYSDRMVTTGYFRDEKMKLWKNHWTKEEFEDSLKNAGWKIDNIEKVPQLSQYVYSCISITKSNTERL